MALTDGTTRLTYAALHDRVVQEAAVLRRDGLGPGSLVPLPVQERTTATIVSLLAILAAGAAFTPVPAGTDGDAVVRGIASDPSAWPRHLAPDAAPAYVLTTSGSTGAAKHTVVTREGLRGVFGGLHARLRDLLPLGARWTQLHPLTFGYSICEVLGSLVFGGTLTLVEREEPVTLTALSRVLTDEPGPHVVCLTPSELSVLISAEHAPLPSHLLLSGEPAHRAPLRELFARAGTTPPVVVNTYAATETSGQVTTDLVTADRLDAVFAGHVGHPLPGVEVLLRGPDGGPVPDGDTATEGEIEVRGVTVSGGYLDDAAHRETFLAAGPERAFRTGDRGRWSADGGLVVTGRAERRVKLAGRWTALDEIERSLTEDGLAAEAVAAVEEYAVDGASAGRLLVAIVPAGADRAETAVRVRRRVLRLLGGPVTVRTVLCEEIPRTTHGKTDLAALRQAPQPTAAGTGIAGTVMRVWGELLGAGFPSDANLFECGVDSLGVVAAAIRLTEALGRKVTPTFLFDHPRIALQIEALSAPSHQGAPARPPADPPLAGQAPTPQAPVRQAGPQGSAADRRRAARLSDGAPALPARAEGVTQ